MTDIQVRCPSGMQDVYKRQIIGNLLKEKAASVKVLETADKWFGVTYQEDKQTVIDAFHELVDKGVYRSPLYE